MTRRRFVDQEERECAIAERDRNVIADAGAGTGKTTLLVSRLISLIAPESDGVAAMDLRRIAAVSFTRKAAGELKLRIREKLLSELSGPKLSPLRRERLRAALDALDTALIGTVHSFADRLLRLRPREARLSPAFEIVEDAAELEAEAFDVLLQAVESGALAERLRGSIAEERCVEVAQTLSGGLKAGVRADDREGAFQTTPGLRGLFTGFIRNRDVVPSDPKEPELDWDELRARARELLRLARPVKANSGPIGKWLQRAATLLEDVGDSDEPFAVLTAVLQVMATQPRKPLKKEENDPNAWPAWKRWSDAKEEVPLREQLTAPVFRWFTHRLVRAFPVVIAVYEQVKAAHQAVDQIDLLLKLRDLLRDDRAVRAELQALFDHLFVDEFQDTDPLQAEIILFLCEDGAKARRWDQVVVKPGKLTLVGDPKQSIYRFRRADIQMYESVRAMVVESPHVQAKLRTNFRSPAPLIEWFNDRFDQVLGVAEEGEPLFDADEGLVVNEHLEPGRPGQGARVRIVPYGFEEKARAPEYRELEARALASYLRWLVEVERPEIVDPVSGQSRAVNYGDIAVLAITTSNLSLLFTELDRLDLPYASRGGTLFLSDPVHRQFLLGLRAIADPDDGPAQAALLRPPFFAIDLADLVREAAGATGQGSAEERESVERVRQARALIAELRERRYRRGPGETARDLLERTGFARHLALGPNGAQRVARLRELCLGLERTAFEGLLDFDAATAIARGWVDTPAQLDPPAPLGQQTLQILSVHQAKGLEFPVVVLWDGCGGEHAGPGAAWMIERDGGGWGLSIDGLKWEEPEGVGLADRERRFKAAEMLRVIYVAATRARDLLVIPQAGVEASRRYYWGRLTADPPEHLVEIHEPLIDGGTVPAWAAMKPGKPRAPGSAAKLEAAVGASWGQALEIASRASGRPVSVSSLVHAGREVEREGEAVPAPESRAEAEEGREPRRPGRFGRHFGSTVHRAIGLALEEPGCSVAEAVARAAREIEFEEHLPEAEADVERALDALAELRLRRRPGPDLALEYPVAAGGEGCVVVGYLDLLAVGDDGLVVLDFKTDAPPTGDSDPVFLAYQDQVNRYAEMLEEITMGRPVRRGLLFTADGRVRWASAPAAGAAARSGRATG